MSGQIDGLEAPLEAVERRQKRLEVYTDSDDLIRELRHQFATRNVEVVQQPVAATHGKEFVIVRTSDGEYSGALGVDQFLKILSPDPQFRLDRSAGDGDLTDLFDFLDNTLFASFDRRQMLAVSREIEERAWRLDRGTLYVGFQNEAAFRAQRPLYERFAADSGVSIRIFIVDELTEDVTPSIAVVSEDASEIGRYWFLLFDGGSQQDKCGLIAEERDPDQFYGFWTYEPDLVEDIISYLRRTYVTQQAP